MFARRDVLLHRNISKQDVDKKRKEEICGITTAIIFTVITLYTMQMNTDSLTYCCLAISVHENDDRSANVMSHPKGWASL